MPFSRVDTSSKKVCIKGHVIRLWKIPGYNNPEEHRCIEMVVIDEEVCFLLVLNYCYAIYVTYTIHFYFYFS